jgi:hypothetical protein
MKPMNRYFARLTETLLFLVVMVGLWVSLAHAAPPTSAFGVWDRSDRFDSKDYPFLKGFAFDQRWAEIENEPGVFDLSRLDKAIEKSIQRNQFVYMSLSVGPDAPPWI